MPLVYVEIDWEKNKVAPDEKRKNYVGFQFSYSKSMTNFEVFR